MNSLAITYGFYLALLAMAGAGEYLHLLPMGTTATVLGGIFGHGISEVSRKNTPATTGGEKQ